MESIVITWRELLLVLALILAVYIAEMLLLMRTGGGILRKRERKRGHEELQSIRSELGNLSSRLQALEHYIQQMQSEGESETPYSRAIQMARQGRDVTRISETCGISHGEAELIVSMHGPRNDS